jgi:alkylated DNA repair protein alkB family protein 5
MVPPFPPILERLVAVLVDQSKLLPAAIRPDSVIINSYSAGDCIPPHVDHASYYRPISTLSLLGEEPMLVGSKFRTVKASTWEPVVGVSALCPRRSLLVLDGNSANIAKHCISACSGPRISITLRKQPDADWAPNVAELVGDAPQNKRRALSGSAKRRKKKAKQRYNS